MSVWNLKILFHTYNWYCCYVTCEWLCLCQAQEDVNVPLEAEKVVEQLPAPSFATVTFEPEPGTDIYGEKIETVLYRDAGGLGFSIAGGRGSVPYKGNDNVSIFTYMLDSFVKSFIF